MWFIPIILAVAKLRQEGCCMFEVSLDCRVNSRSVRAIDAALPKNRKETEAPEKRTDRGYEYGCPKIVMHH